MLQMKNGCDQMEAIMDPARSKSSNRQAAKDPISLVLASMNELVHVEVLDESWNNVYSNIYHVSPITPPPSHQTFIMPPKGSNTKLAPPRLPPLPKLRVRRPNQPGANPCVGIMTSVLGLQPSE